MDRNRTNNGLGRLVTIDIETTTEVAGAPSVDDDGNEVRPGLDPRYGAITDVAVLVDEGDGARRAQVISVGAVTPRPMWTRLGGTTLETPPFDVSELEVDGYADVKLATCDSERSLLDLLVQSLRLELDGDTTLVGWNSATFDLPFIADRAAECGVAADRLGLELAADPSVFVKYDPLPGHDGGYRALVNGARHLDIQEAFRAVAESTGVKHSLKPVAIASGLDPVEVDRERMHELTLAERVAYVLSDSELVADLAVMFADELSLGEHIDRLPTAA